MKVNLTVLMFVATLLAGCGDSKKQDPILIGYGKYFSTTSEIVDDSDPSQGPQTYEVLESLKLVEQTSTISNKLGEEFGIEYMISSPLQEGYVEIEEVVLFPAGGLTDPATGATITMESDVYELPLNEPTYFGYGLDYEWERKPGDWKFQVKRQGAVILEQIFTIN